MIDANTHLSEHFIFEELLPPEIFKALAAKPEYMRGLIDNRLPIILEALRARYCCKGGKLIVNDWLWSGSYHNSGLRAADCVEGAKWSQHRYGRAADIKFFACGITPAEVRADLRAGRVSIPLLTAVEEDTDTWLHVDCRNHSFNGILWVPKS